MTAPPSVDYREQLTAALREVRCARHHMDCHCGLYRDTHGSPYCTAGEWRWSSSLDRILTTVLREQQHYSYKPS
jgi:hypothetical protein